MMAPDYTHWHGMYEVADRFYMSLIPQAREVIHLALSSGKKDQAGAAQKALDGILARPEHKWFSEGAAGDAARIREAMKARYGNP